MTYTKEKPDELLTLAAYLAERRPFILQAWRQAVDQDPDLTTAASLSGTQFFDHIPVVLDDFENALRGQPPKVATAASETGEGAVAHGKQRWQQGYRLREVSREWGHLHLCLLDELERFSSAHPEQADRMPAARRALARLCHGGVSDSADQFFRLRQLEAAGQVRDLEAALDRWGRAERQQAESWREVAHDLRGRLGVVRNVSYILNHSDGADPDREELLGMLDKGVTGLTALLEDVASLARLQAGHEKRQLAAVDAAALLREWCAGHQPLARERGLALKAEGPEALPVEADAVKLGRIVQNLLLNALKYTERGSVTVSWGDSLANDPRRWMLCVQDTGPGIAGAAAPLVGALKDVTRESKQVDGPAPAPPYPRGGATPTNEVKASRDNPQPGEGIGLSIVKRLCELLDATLEVQSQPGAGTTFRVILPRAYPA